MFKKSTPNTLPDGVEIDNFSLFANVLVPVETGPLKLTVMMQIIYYLDDQNKIIYDVEVMDYKNIFYLGKSISSEYSEWQKFREFHKGIGIDFEEQIETETQRILTDEVILKIKQNVKLEF